MRVLKNAGADNEDFEYWFTRLARELITAPAVDTGHWQALKGVPQTKTHEIHNAVLEFDMPPVAEQAANMVMPNLPWAEDHFAERVGGLPLNPGVQYRNWPYYRGNVEQHQNAGEEQFSHTYMERLWPREASSAGDDKRVVTQYCGWGIRYRCGDLEDVINLLQREPHTRQAYVPLWFPEDTGAHADQRVPCTLGYHFMLRQDRLHCFYPIRSCDLLRHFRDDVYMAMRLTQWMIHKCQDGGGNAWKAVLPGQLTMFIPSLHVFEGDMPSLKRKYA